ncbi:MAG: 4-(cytidine 5'-diphospho)-2-C-methyl-D-erythritol kinase [Lishizhenia sp.]
MISFPGCKINLGLDVLNKRADGYHEIESVLFPIPWKDALEIIPATSFQFTSSGLTIPGNASNNLCVKAYDLLKKTYGIPHVHIHLHKIIPMGGGLGGGSADGAEVLKLLNKLFDLKITQENLKEFAAQLGSDCPFFIENKPQFASGTGTELESVDLNLNGYYIKLINNGTHVSTAEAYASITFSKTEEGITRALQQPIEKWQNRLQNSFESSVFKIHPELEELKLKLLEEGAVYASMTGSGSTLYGIYKSEPEPTFADCSFEKILAL